MVSRAFDIPSKERKEVATYVHQQDCHSRTFPTMMPSHQRTRRLLRSECHKL